jgi:hypothetical protein
MVQPFLLELEGRLAGRFFDFTGGMAHGEVVVEKSGPGQLARKHVARVKYEDMVLACGAGMSRSFYDWIGSAFGGSPRRLSGAVIQLDHSSKPTARREFAHALISSIVLPELDNSSNREAVMTVSIKPETTFQKEADGAENLGVYTSALPKTWHPRNFHFTVDGLLSDCRHVTKLSSLTLGVTIKEVSLGDTREPGLEPVMAEFPNFSIEIPGQHADGFYKWYDDMVVKGNTNSASERNGSIEFLAPGSTKPYFVVSLSGLGIYGISSAFHKKSALPITVKLYCESMSFSAGAAAIR